MPRSRLLLILNIVGNARRASYNMTEIEININKYAQNKLTYSEMMDSFDQHDLIMQKEIREF